MPLYSSIKVTGETTVSYKCIKIKPLLVPSSIVKNFLKKSTLELDSALAAFTFPKMESYEGGGAAAYNQTGKIQHQEISNV